MINIIKIKRIQQLENRYHRNMGRLQTRVTQIKKTIFGIPYKTLHKYRETYMGEIKDCEDCNLSKVR